jgi:hypothetical protein
MIIDMTAQPDGLADRGMAFKLTLGNLMLRSQG